MVDIPPTGEYWSRRQFPADMSLSDCRQGATSEFDNAASASFPAHHAKDRFLDMIRPECRPLLNDSPRGNPTLHPMEIGNQRYMVTYSSIEFAAMVSHLWDHMAGVRSVIEIGGGYGGLALSCLRAFPRLERWTIIDIPSTARVSRWYLSDQCKATVLDVSDVETIQPADMVIQTRGFMEMDLAEVRFYFDLMQGRWLAPGGLFYTVNRKEKRTRFADYPFDGRWETLFMNRWPSIRETLEGLYRRTA